MKGCYLFLVPYGGGGLITGISSAVKHLKPSMDIFASEIDTAAPLSAALKSGEIEKITIEKSWIDAIGHANVMKEMWPLVKDSVDGSFAVSLKETANALKLLIERSHMICEGASATALAAALWHYPNLLKQGKAGLRYKSTNKPVKVVALLTGAGIGSETVIKCLNDAL